MGERTFTPDQGEAFHFLTETDVPLYISGAAGVGKSYVLQSFIEYCKNTNINVIVTAPTGIAALNVHGTTIHRGILGQKFGDLAQADVIVIDEISMCRIDLFERVMAQVEAANRIRVKRGRKPIRLILFGDFGQLPPVVTDDDKKHLKKIKSYKDVVGYYAFESKKWHFQRVALTTVVRQEDPHFATALNEIRLGDKSGLDYIAQHKAKEKIPDAISIVCKNKTAAEINAKNIEKLATTENPICIFKSEVMGKVEDGDKPVEDRVSLVVGARVVSLVNGADLSYANGSQGIIEGIKPNQGVTVLFDNGVEAFITPYTWEILEPQLEEAEDTDGNKVQRLENKPVGKYTQIPLKPGYAITVHKSQGQTYDAANLVMGAWAEGQLYTQLSRVKDVTKMHVQGDLYAGFLKTSQVFLDFENGSYTRGEEVQGDDAKIEWFPEALLPEKAPEKAPATATYTLRMDPDVKDRLVALLKAVPGKNQSEKLITLMDCYESKAEAECKTHTSEPVAPVAKTSRADKLNTDIDAMLKRLDASIQSIKKKP